MTKLELVEIEIEKLQGMKKRLVRADKGVPRKKYTMGQNRKYVSYLKRANSKGFGFNLTEAHFEELENSICVYCGDPATGFDRIDSSKGYLDNNVAPCCKVCNTMKWSHPRRDFINHITKIYQYIN